LAQSGKRKRLFEEAEEWILAGIATGFFPLRISVRFVGLTPNMSAKGSYDGRKEITKVSRLQVLGRKKMAG